MVWSLRYDPTQHHDHRLRHIDTHLCTLPYNNTAKNNYAEPVHNKTMKIFKYGIDIHNINLMQYLKYAISSYSHIPFFSLKKGDILIPDFRYLLCFV